MPCSTISSIYIYQTEIFSTDTADFLKQIFFIKSFNSAFNAKIKFQISTLWEGMYI